MVRAATATAMVATANGCSVYAMAWHLEGCDLDAGGLACGKCEVGGQKHEEDGEEFRFLPFAYGALVQCCWSSPEHAARLFQSVPL